jgi:MoxR-like ATPase
VSLASTPARATGAVSSPDTLARLRKNVSSVVRGKPEAIRLALVSVCARGHLLIEDVPGVGKTTLARALARSIGGRFHRVQFTSDLLPSDVIGVSVYDQRNGRFEFKPGPLFANVVLVDEINRASPRTQSALLEAMNEAQVSVDDVTYPLPRPFVVLATQNPQEHYGTYPLPESQLDRFLLRLRIGYPSAADEREVIRGADDDASRLGPVASLDEVVMLQEAATQVRVDDDLVNYVLAVVSATRDAVGVRLGVSPRGAKAWYRAAQASALVDGRTYCTPDDFKSLAGAVLAHRMSLATGDGRASHADTERALTDILERVPVPE